MIRFYRNITAVAALLGSAALLFSCSRQTAVVEEENNQNMMTQQSENLTVIQTKEGNLSFRFSAPLLEEYEYAEEPYIEFRKGIEIGGLSYGEDHGIGGDGAGLRFIKRRAERAGSVLDGKAGFDGEAGNGVRAFDAHWAPAALEIDALVAGVGDIVRIGWQFGFGLKGNHAHGRCSEAFGGNGRVDGNVAAAHDNDMARKRRSVIAAYGAQELHAPQHAGQFGAFNGEFAAEAGSGGKEESLVTAAAQVAEGQVASLADAGVAAEADAEGFKPGHMCLDHGVGQAVSRDAVAEHAAGARPRKR